MNSVIKSRLEINLIPTPTKLYNNYTPPPLQFKVQTNAVQDFSVREFGYIYEMDPEVAVWEAQDGGLAAHVRGPPRSPESAAASRSREHA